MTTLASTPITVSLNGSDNVGKTTQLGWLARALRDSHHMGTIDRWHERWSEVGGPGFSSWWFEKSSTEEHTQLVAASHGLRRQASGQLALEDRGLPMLLATCAATSSIKDGLEPADALDKVTSIAECHLHPDERREVHVLLRRRDDPHEEAEAAIFRELGPVNDTYRAYQRVLATVIAMQVEFGAYDVVLRVGDDPILEVQRQLRLHLAETGVPVEILPEAPIERLWVLGGMSESGKSTVGELLRDEYGVTRLKIGYLLEQAALRAGEADPYAWPPTVQAAHLSEEVVRFAAANHAYDISLESAHGLEQARLLKATWGDRCQVVYLDAPLQTRAARTDEDTSEFSERDAIKTSRGADGIRTIADTVIDNSGPLSGLKLRLASLTREVSPPSASTPPSWAPAQDHAWLELATQRLVDDLTTLVLATGSTGKTNWIEGWSDVDLLVVRDEISQPWLEAVTTALTREGFKVGLSAFTTTDVTALRVPARVIGTMRNAADGTGILYRRADYLIPRPSLNDLDRAGRADLGLILMNTRRLLAASVPDVRALYKHLLLITRVLLQADGVEPSTPDVIDVFSARHTDPAWNPPTSDTIVDFAHDPAVVDQLTDAVEHVLQHIDNLGRNTQ